MRFITSLLILSFSICHLSVHAETQSKKPAPGKMVKVFPEGELNKSQVPYWLYLPKHYNAESKEKYPVVIFLHGMGERGNTLDPLLKHGPTKMISQGKHYPFILIAPQCPNDGKPRSGKAKAFWWKKETILSVKGILDHRMNTLNIDPDRVYITGLSMGGFGTYHLLSLFPKTFAAAVPICGQGNAWPDKSGITHIPIWAFHGEKDPVVSLKSQQQTVDAIKDAGGNIKFTIYPGVKHDSWTKTYANPEVYEWLLKHKRK